MTRSIVATCTATAWLLVSNAEAKTVAQVQTIAPLNLKTRHHAEKTLRKLGLLGAGTPLVRIRSLPMANLPASSKSLEASIKPSAVSTQLTFVFKGFDEFAAGENTKYQNFFSKAYATLVSIYGEPVPSQRGKAIAVKYLAGAGDGIYYYPNENDTSGGRIEYEPVAPGSNLSQSEADALNFYNLTRLVFRAFHGRSIFESDAWEQGFVDAASMAVIGKYYPDTLDRSKLGVYLLNVYDLFNRPNLGNKYFFPDGNTTSDTGNLGFYRMGMAQAAWLKVYVEDPTFFRKINTAYNLSLNGSDSNLKSIAAGIVPRVEGLPFADWMSRQYILDTRIVPGNKLWFATIPISNNEVGGVAQWYRTVAPGGTLIFGNELPNTGRGTVVAKDERARNITAKSPALAKDTNVVFNALGEAEIDSQNQPGPDLPIITFSSLGSETEAERARITLQVRAGAQTADAYFPYGVMEVGSKPSFTYGATVGADSGVLRISMVANGKALAASNAKIERAVFQGTGTAYPSVPSVKTTYTLVVSGMPIRTFIRNSAWSSRGFQAAVLETGLANPVDSVLPLKLNPGLRMIAPPIEPLYSDQAASLKIPATSLALLGRYRPNLDVAKTGDVNLTYGITTNKHDLYPRPIEKFAPGRGFWIKVNSATNAALTGIVPPTSSPYEVPLQGGWNQFGVPFNLRFALGAVRVVYRDAAPVAWTQAINSGLVSTGIWRWKIGGGYGRVDTGATTTQFLEPLEGYYIFSPKPEGVKLIFDTRQGIATAASAPASANNWQLPLMAASGTERDADNAFGVTSAVGSIPARRAGAKPPAAERALTVRFLSSGNGLVDATKAGNETGWAESLVAPITTLARWSFNVDGAKPGQLVQLTWGDPTKLPVALDFVLRDITANKEVALTGAKRVNSYSFTAASGARRFFIQAKKSVVQTVVREVPQLLLSVVGQAGSKTATLTVQVNTASLLPYRVSSLEILTLDGQVVRTLDVDRVVRQTPARWQWDGRDDAGSVVTAGLYTVRLRWSVGSDVPESSNGRDDASVAEQTALFELR